MKVSERIDRIAYSPIRKLAPLADAAKSRGLKVFHLNIGQPDIHTPDCGLASLGKIDRKVLEYSPSDGFLSLRERLSAYYSGYGLDFSPSEIIVTTGASEALMFLFMTCMDFGDEVIMAEPTYANYLAFAAAAGVRAVPVGTDIRDGFALPSPEAFERLITPRTKAILICNPNNPTGYLYSRSELETLRDIVVKNGLFLFCDEVYREFVYSDEPYVSAFHIGGMDGNLVLIDSVSKRYSECGTRIGCLCTRNRAVHDAVMKFCQARLSPPLIGQIVAEASIDVPQDYMKAVYDEYLGRRDFLLEGLNRIPGVFSPVPKGAFYTMARLPVDDAEKFCLWCLKDFRYEGRTVMLAPGAGFYTEPGEGRDEVRIAYVLCREDLAMALTVLEKALEAYPGRTV